MEKYIVWIILLAFLSNGCNKEEETLLPSSKGRAWIEILDKPGELNQLRFQLYKKYGISLYVNDTIGSENRGTDAYGKPIIYYELLRPGYTITSASNWQVNLSSDTPNMVKATKFMLDFVAPRLAKNEKYRPYTYFLCNSIQTSGAEMWTGAYTSSRKLYQAAKTTSISITDFSSLTDVEQKIWATRILGNAIATKIINVFETELESFYKITDEGFTSSQYGRSKNYYGVTELPESRILELHGSGFLDHGQIKYYIQTGRLSGYSPTAAEDVEDYVGAVLAFTDKEFEQSYGKYDNMIRKYRFMQDIVTRFKKEFLNE